MTVAALPSTVSYIEDGVSVAFPVPYRFKSPNDLIVERIVGGVEYPLAIGVDYTVAGGASDAGGTVTRTAATNGATLRIRRETQRAQPMVYTTGDRFPATSHEEALDRQMLVAQEQDAAIGDVTRRGLLVPPGETVGDLPPAIARRDTVMTFDPFSGEPLLRRVGSFPPGPPGGAGNVVQSIGQLRATAVSSGTMIAAYDGSGSPMTWTVGDFTALAALYPQDHIASDFLPLSVGAWVRQRVDVLTFQQQPDASPANGPSPLYSPSLALRETTSLERWYRPGDGDWYAASRRASLEAATTGVPIKMRNRDYSGARIEVHRTMGVEGNGARIDYIGIGNTPIAGVGSGAAAQFSAWPTTDTDAMADRYPVRMYSVLSADRFQIELDTVVGLAVGMWVQIAQDPAPNSSPSNLIPQNFEMAQIIRITGRIIRFRGVLDHLYNASARVFQCDGLAVNCAVRDLTLTTNTDAYQWVTRSAVNLLMENVIFAGENAVGAGTFQRAAMYRNFQVNGSYGSFSIARCSESVTLDGFDYAPQTPTPVAQPLSIFVEESIKTVRLRNLNIRGGGILVGSIQNPAAQGERRLFIDRFIVDTTQSQTPYAPLAIASAAGVDISVSNGSLVGHVMQHDAGNFGGVPPCLIPMTANLMEDFVTFDNVAFKSSNLGAAIGRGGGFLGRPSINMDTCRFHICTPPETYARARREKSGTVMMGGTTYDVEYSTFMPEPYVIQLASDAQAPVSWSDKGGNGFRLHAPAGARVDWRVSEVAGG